MTIEDSIVPSIVLEPLEQFSGKAVGGESTSVVLQITKRKRQWLVLKRPASQKLQDISDEELLKNPTQYLRKEYAIEQPLSFEETDTLLNIVVDEGDIASIVALVQANLMRRKENERKRKSRA